MLKKIPFIYLFSNILINIYLINLYFISFYHIKGGVVFMKPKKVWSRKSSIFILKCPICLNYEDVISRESEQVRILSNGTIFVIIDHMPGCNQIN